jgi:hypothetical protein
VGMRSHHRCRAVSGRDPDAGLLWAINGGRLVQLHRDWAVIDVPVNRSERVSYRRNVDVAKITLPWRKQD